MTSKAWLVASFFFTGCATAYQSGQFSYTGGYIDLPVNDQMRKVVFYANGFTGVETAVKYARFRCAELAEAAGKPYFIMYPSLEDAAIGRTSRVPSAGNIGNKPAAYAFLTLSDESKLGSIKTSEVIEELRAMRDSYQQAKSGTDSTKKKK